MAFTSSWRNDRSVQYVATILATLTMASIGTYLTWVSPVLPKLMKEDSVFGLPISDDESSWIVSTYFLGVTLGCFPAWWMIERFGRRTSLIVSAVPLSVPWFVIAFTKSITILYVCRFVGGIGVGFVITDVPIYVSEIADKDIRGRLGIALSVLKFMGALYVLGLGPFVSYEVLSLTCSAIPIVFAISFYFMPESPYYLVKVKQRDRARENLSRLLGSNNTTKIDDRLEEIESIVSYDMQNKSTFWEFVTKKDYRQSLIIITGIKTLQALSGMYTISSYIQTIIGVSKSNVSPEVSSAIAGIVQVISAFVAGVLVDRIGRRKLFMVSTLGCALASAGEAIYFYLQDSAGADVSRITWLPTASLLLYFLACTMGIYALPFVLLGELFATNVKLVAVATSSAYAIGLSFAVTKMFQPISSVLGMYAMFAIFAISCLLGSIFIYFSLPETKGKTFEEIQRELNPNRRTENKRNDATS